MKSQDLKNLITEESESLLILDVREREEFESEPLLPNFPAFYQHLPLTLLSVLPKEELIEKFHGFGWAPSMESEVVTIVTVCRSGVRSAKARDILALHGIAVESLEGGVSGFGG